MDQYIPYDPPYLEIGEGGEGGGDPFPPNGDFGGVRTYVDPDGNGVAIFSGEIPVGYILVSEAATNVVGTAVQIQGSDSVALAVPSGPSIQLDGTGNELQVVSNGDIFINAETGLFLGGNDQNATIGMDPDGIQISALAIGFFGSFPVNRPEVPASPTVQDLVDALVALGLITQAP